ncbi:hypothetical protein GTY62_15285 [Streptomyces sp. SID724]|uniref:hypothetical protein n=1 Tax=Streptomyces sp. SID724 TaxID=2690324 RepID=UPI00136123B0|nr:hypothetical protein [Streptomyces sp. SID724]
MATATAQPQQAPAQGKGGKAAPPVLRPFFPGTLDLETHTYVKTGTLTTSQIPLDTFYPKTNGFLADLWIEMETNATPNTNANTAFNEDFPLRAISVFTLSDTGGQPILGPMTGWELAQFVKHGGFSFSDDPTQSQTYKATTGTSTAGGSFSFILQIPVQFVRREPLGVLPNTNSNNAYAVDITISTLAQIYSVAPNTAPTYKVSVYQDSYRQSSGKDAQKNSTVTTPPGLGAVLYLRRNTMDLSAGSVDEELSQQEGSYRALHFVLRDSNGSRLQGDADWPDPVQIYFNNDVPYDRTKRFWIRRMERDYGYVAAVNTPGGRDYGVFTLPFITDNGLKAGSEDRYKYLSVSAADTLGFRGVVGGSGTHVLTTMYNFVRPPGGNIKGLTAR